MKEMEPEIIVPVDLDGCRLRPYVTYKASVGMEREGKESDKGMEREGKEPDKGMEREGKEFTAKSLFDAVYRERIQSVLSDTDLSEEERREEMHQFLQVDPESIHEARIRARQSGSDLFVPRGWCGIGRERDDNWN